MYNIEGVVAIGEVKYKISEIARLAGVSKRTIDYYTNLGLLNPVRSENNYRYYTEESLVRLKMIEGMKKKRFTLDEIKKQLNLLDNVSPQEMEKAAGEGAVNVDLLRKQIKQLEEQLVQLQSVAAINTKQALQLKNRIMAQSMVLIQSLLMYINEITSGL